MERKSFWEIFKVYPDGSIEPLRSVRIGGVQFGPGVRFGKGVSFSGIDLTLYVGRDLQIEQVNGIATLKGIY